MTTTFSEKRTYQEWMHYPVGRVKVTSTVLDTTAAIETDVAVNGLTKQLHFIIPALDVTDTAELLLHDAEDNILYASGELAQSTSHVINAERALCGTITIRIETSTAQAADRAFTVYIYYL